MLERYLAPGIKVADVKVPAVFIVVCAPLQMLVLTFLVLNLLQVPLNAYTPETLGSVARVRGISDFSIERLIEQTVANGGVCIVHMEEVPSSEPLQTELFTVLTRVFKKLDHFYPVSVDPQCWIRSVGVYHSAYLFVSTLPPLRIHSTTF
jgi:hypothetical protein